MSVRRPDSKGEHFVSESHRPPRRLRASIARRIGRFLGVSDLFTTAHALQRQSEAQDRELGALRSQVRQLTEHLDGLTTSENHHRLGLAVWIATTYLAQFPVRERTLISVVLSTHNRSALVQRAITSVMAQSYTNWELVVVDDASNDDTPQVLRAFTDPRIQVLRREEQGGASATRNAGLEKVRGEYIAYLDDDNVMHPHWLRGVAWAFELNPDADVMIGARIIDDERRNQGLGRGGWPQLAPPWFDRDRIAHENVADLIQIAHRRDLDGVRFDEQLTIVEDWDLLARLTRDRDPLLFPALAGIYTTSASDRFMDSGSLERESRRVREKIAAMKSQSGAQTTLG
jgi:hypothetical protein